MKLCLCFVLLTRVCPALAQWATRDATARGLAGAGLARLESGLRPENPAALPSSTMVWFGESDLYGTAGIHPMAAGIVVAANPARYGATVVSLRLDGWSYLRVAAGLARNVGSTGVGLRLSGIRWRAGPYAARAALHVTVGAIVPVSHGFAAAAFVGRGTGDDGVSGSEATLGTAIAWRVPRLGNLLVDLVRIGHHPISTRVGFEIRPTGSLFLRAGTSTTPERIACGVGLVTGRIRFDLGLDRHPDLGLSVGLDVAIGLRS